MSIYNESSLHNVFGKVLGGKHLKGKAGDGSEDSGSC